MCGGSEDIRGAGAAFSPDPRRMEVFAEAMTPPGPAFLRDLEREARAQGVPVIRPQTQDLLRFFVTLRKPARILEVGAAVGFSALLMGYYAPRECRIVTIELDPGRAAQARDNFKKYGADNISLLEGDAAQVLPQIGGDGTFDLIFMDAAKGQYIRFLPEVLRLLAPEGLLITDNILQEGEVLSSRFAVTRRNRTIHRRMREYLRALMEEPALETLLLPNGDGAAVSVKKGEWC